MNGSPSLGERLEFEAQYANRSPWMTFQAYGPNGFSLGSPTVQLVVRATGTVFRSLSGIWCSNFLVANEQRTIVWTRGL